jgi:RNA-directed DNA polymerase
MPSQARAEMAVHVHASIGSHQPSPVRRVHVPKASDKTKMRPLGIPVLPDRCHQARVRHALEPEWEARFEPRSYGFRPGRGCHDAIESLFRTLHGKSRRVWILDADLAAAFGKISHDHLLQMIGGFPARGMIAGWLKAGVFEAGKGFAPTEEGTPQGGVISPLLLNIALHGLEEAAGVRYKTGSHAGEVRDGCPALTRYADDLVVCCHSRQQAEQARARLAGWLEPRGLAFNEAKTRIVHLSEGFGFLGFDLRRYPSGKLLIKPGAETVKRFRGRLAKEFRALRGANVQAVLGENRPDHTGLDRPLPDRGVVQGVQCPVRIPVEAHLEVGVLEPPEQAETLDCRPVLPEVRQVQERPVGVRRPGHRRLPAETGLDGDRAAHHGQRRGIT